MNSLMLLEDERKVGGKYMFQFESPNMSRFLRQHSPIITTIRPQGPIWDSGVLCGQILLPPFSHFFPSRKKTSPSAKISK